MKARWSGGLANGEDAARGDADESGAALVDGLAGHIDRWFARRLGAVMLDNALDSDESTKPGDLELVRFSGHCRVSLLRAGQPEASNGKRWECAQPLHFSEWLAADV